MSSDLSDTNGIINGCLVAQKDIAIKETATPPDAVTDVGRLYTKSDNKLYFQDGDGVEHHVMFSEVLQHIGWRVSPTVNGTINVLGWNIQTDSGASLSSGLPVTAGEPGYHSHFIIDVSGAVGLPFTIRVTGRSINESSGVTTPGDTEDLTINANGYYQTSKSWIDAVQFSIVELAKSCSMDIYRNTYWDYANRDFTLRGIRLEFVPDVTTWSMQVVIYHVQNDGSLVEIDNFTFANTDTVPRAAMGKPGKHKRGDYNTDINGAAMEGIIVKVVHTNIKYFYLELRYNE